MQYVICGFLRARASWGVELSTNGTEEHGRELAVAMVGLAEKMLQRGTVVESGQRPLEASMIGLACAHISQVHALQERLGSQMEGVLVGSADRFQGLERPVMVVHDPPSGHADADEFHLDAGCLCVIVPIRTENHLHSRARLGGGASEVHFEVYHKVGDYASATTVRWRTP